MLIVTNGDCAARALGAARLPGQVLPWRDVLHDGPVPAGLRADRLAALRARFIAASGWGDEAAVRADLLARDETLAHAAGTRPILLWFEHDLYDQLQLLQVLDRLGRRRRVGSALTLVCRAELVAELDAATAATRFASREPVTRSQLQLARRAWTAFRAPTPEAIARLGASETPDLPFLRLAVTRLLEEYPSAENGLARSERQILDVARRGAVRLRDAFIRYQDLEEAPYAGDASFWTYVQRLATCRTPLLTLRPGREAQDSTTPDGALPDVVLDVTSAGRQVAEGARDHLALNGIDRWIGGVHLTQASAWRRDPASGRLLPP